MKKFIIIATAVTFIAVTFSSVMASAFFFNQPKSPSMLSK